MKAQIFDGRASEMRDSPWLASEDLDGVNEVTLTISNVYKNADVEFEGGRKKEIVFSLEFEKAKRQLILNGTNRKSLIKAFGADVKGWIGKRVVVYVEDNIKVGREIKKGLRVRLPKEDAAKSAQATLANKSDASLNSVKK